MEPRSFNRGDSQNPLENTDNAPFGLQWSHGRLTVVTLLKPTSADVGAGLQWSHGRLTVVTGLR